MPQGQTSPTLPHAFTAPHSTDANSQSLAESPQDQKHEEMPACLSQTGPCPAGGDGTASPGLPFPCAAGPLGTMQHSCGLLRVSAPAQSPAPTGRTRHRTRLEHPDLHRGPLGKQHLAQLWDSSDFKIRGGRACGRDCSRDPRQAPTLPTLPLPLLRPPGPSRHLTTHQHQKHLVRRLLAHLI